MRTGLKVRVGGQPVDGAPRSRRPLVLRVALLSSASMMLLGVVAGCVQAPVANPAPYALTDADSTSQAYTPDSVPVVVPGLGGAPDVSTPSGDESTPSASPADPGAMPTMEGPATKAPATAAPGQAQTQAAATQPQATQAPATAAPTVAPTTAQATAAKTATAGTQALVGPGVLELTCTHQSNGKTKAVLKWDNPGFTASVTVNGKVTTQTNTKSTSLTVSVTETIDGHGICAGRVGDSTTLKSY